MRTLAAKEDLQALIDDEVEEGLHLDFKECDALRPVHGKTKGDRKSEVCRDVAAFANADGGVLMYGIIEKAERAVAIDQGYVAGEPFSQKWFEQVLTDGLSPRVLGTEVTMIDLANGHHALAVRVGKSFRGPHQVAADKVYYRRYGRERRPMEDYEIEEVRRRREVAQPVLVVSLQQQGAALMQIVLSNISDYGVHDIKVDLSDDLRVHYEKKKDGQSALLRGFSYMGPRQRLVFDGDVYWKIVNGENSFGPGPPFPKQFTIGVRYRHPVTDGLVEESHSFDLLDIYGSAARKTDAESLVAEIRAGAKTIADALLHAGNQQRTGGDLNPAPSDQAGGGD